jgi:hypothetical protein
MDMDEVIADNTSRCASEIALPKFDADVQLAAVMRS